MKMLFFQRHSKRARDLREMTKTFEADCQEENFPRRPLSHSFGMDELHRVDKSVALKEMSWNKVE